VTGMGIVRTARRKTEKAAAFTLLEMMVVLVIIGILATVALGNYLSFQCRSKQAEAKTNLGAIFTSQEAYRAEYDRYSNSLGEIGWESRGTTRYIYSATATGATSFTGQATTAGGANLDSDNIDDVWTVDETRAITNTINDCAN
jgi:type IV pilus assembly protein PilA